MIANRRSTTPAIFAALALLVCFALPADSKAADDPGISNLPAIAHDPPPPFDNRPIHRDSTGPLPAAGKSSAAGIHPTVSAFDPTRVLLAMTGIVGLILLLRWGMRRILPGAVAHRSTRVMKVLSRTLISPRQNLLLIQIGKRLLVVGDSGAQLNPLCQIKDQSEVEAILAELREETISAGRRFDLLFGKARKGFDQDVNAQELPKVSDDADAETPASLTENSSQPEPAFDETHEIADPSLQETRNELTGLSEKVRELARQLGDA